MTIRFGEYKKRDISFLLNFVANLFLYYTDKLVDKYRTHK